MQVKKNIVKNNAVFFIICFGLGILTRVFMYNFFYDFISLTIIGICTLYIVTKIGNFFISNNCKYIILTGYFLRIILLLIAIYGSGPLTDFLTAGDQSRFAEAAEKYFVNDYSEVYTRYPYIVNFIYQVAGPNKIIAQYINIVIWFWGFNILFKVRNDWNNRDSQILIILYSLMPYPLILSVGLLRESILGFLLMCGIYFLYKWMQSGVFRYIIFSILVTFPAILLHSGMLAFWMGAAFIFMFWNWRKGIWVFQLWKILLIVLLGILSILIYLTGYQIPMLMDYIPSKDIFFNQAIKGIYFGNARTDYLTNLPYSTPLQVVLLIFLRCLYFWISPTPLYWNSVIDIFAWGMDVIPCLLLIFINIKAVYRDKKKIGFAGLFVLGVYTLVYGLGTRNAGTAMRHRDTLLGLLILNYIVQMESTNIERATMYSKYNEKIL